MKKIIRKIKNAWRIIKTDGIADFIYIFFIYIKGFLRGKINRTTDYYNLSIPKEEKDSIILKRDKTVYIITAIPFYDIGGGQRGAQLARAFNKMGYRVKFFYSNPSQDHQIKGIELPLETHMCLDKKSIEYIKSEARAEDLFIFESPLVAFDEVIEIAADKHCKIVYENIDNWETSLGNNVLSEETLIKLLKYAVLLVGTSKPLVEQLKHYLKKYCINGDEKKILYLPNAVNDEVFCGVKQYEKPSDLAEGEKTFVYHGSLYGEWFDWELVIGFAKNNPEYAINLIGDATGMRHITNKCPSNIHFLGLKQQIDLPAYLHYADYAFIPFKRGEIGDYVSPIKIFEYISMYSKVLSTTLPDINGYPNVFCGDTVEEWEKIVNANVTANKDEADLFISKNTWNYRASRIIESTNFSINEDILKDNLTIVILNYNNSNVVFKCINSLLDYKEKYGYNIIVVDNGSVDGSYERLIAEYSSEIEIYKNKQNGCASGRNLGAQHVKTKYLLFLDSDQWATNENWLKPYEEVIISCDDFGSIGWAAGFFTPSGTSGTIVDELSYRAMLPQCLCRKDIGYLGSGGMLLETEFFHSIGGFDENYDPTCFEDTDISLKVRNSKKELYYCPYLGVFHLPHQTTENIFAEKNKLVKRNKEYFINKWKNNDLELLNKYTIKVIDN